MQVGMAKAVTLVKAVETAILNFPVATAIPQSTNGTIPNKMAIIREDQVYLVASWEEVIVIKGDLATKVGLAVAVTDIWVAVDTQVNSRCM